MYIKFETGILPELHLEKQFKTSLFQALYTVDWPKIKFLKRAKNLTQLS